MSEHGHAPLTGKYQTKNLQQASRTPNKIVGFWRYQRIHAVHFRRFFSKKIMKLSRVGFSMVLFASSTLFGALSAQATEVKVGAADIQVTKPNISGLLWQGMGKADTPVDDKNGK